MYGRDENLANWRRYLVNALSQMRNALPAYGHRENNIRSRCPYLVNASRECGNAFIRREQVQKTFPKAPIPDKCVPTLAKTHLLGEGREISYPESAIAWRGGGSDGRRRRRYFSAKLGPSDEY